MDQLCIHELLPVGCSICNGADAREKAKRPLQREKWADEIFEHIPVNEEGWISNADLAEASGLTGAQVAAAVAYMRDSIPDLPLVSGPQGYAFTVNEADVSRFRLQRARSAHTTIRRLWSGVLKPYIDQSGDQFEAKRTAKQFERLLEDIEELTA
jgi:hypothetical protein